MITIVSSVVNIPHKALEIYVSGCTRKCKGCQNSEIQEYGIGTKWEIWNEKNKEKYLNPLIKRIWILGGDLLCQDLEDSSVLVDSIKKITDKELWLWTGEEMESILKSEELLKIARKFDYIKTGRYISENKVKRDVLLRSDNITVTLVGDNQKIWRVNGDSFFMIC